MGIVPDMVAGMFPSRAGRSGGRSSAVAVVAGLLLAACGSEGSSDESSAGTVADGDQALGVVASFYPLQFVVERIGGDRVSATNLTPAGAEPHDLELTPGDTAALQDADLVVYLSGFADALDDAVDVVGGDHAFDVAPDAQLDIQGSDDEHDDEHEHAAESTHSDSVHTASSQHDENEAHTGGVDPHFWLDPIRLADVADAVAARLGALDPDHAEEYTANSTTLRAELEALDGEFQTALANCASTDIVTSHTAFAYLAERYGLTQVGISGLSPEEEPSPERLAEVAEFVDEHDVSTIYYETLIDPAIAETIAAETGAVTAVLDPIEGLTDESAGSDYFQVMRSNLATLGTGQGCT
jgi:zinc transport system substrate-binding protein